MPDVGAWLQQAEAQVREAQRAREVARQVSLVTDKIILLEQAVSGLKTAAQLQARAVSELRRMLHRQEVLKQDIEALMADTEQQLRALRSRATGSR